VTEVQTRRSTSRAWPNTIAIVPGPMKQYVLRAFRAGADDGEIAETTGLDCEQVTAIRDHFGINAVVIS
jgi:hypothetical protein